MLNPNKHLPRHSISIELTDENWELLERIPQILKEENCLDTDESEKVVDWREPEVLKVGNYLETGNC